MQAALATAPATNDTPCTHQVLLLTPSRLDEQPSIHTAPTPLMPLLPVLQSTSSASFPSPLSCSCSCTPASPCGAPRCGAARWPRYKGASLCVCLTMSWQCCCAAGQLPKTMPYTHPQTKVIMTAGTLAGCMVLLVLAARGVTLLALTLLANTWRPRGCKIGWGQGAVVWWAGSMRGASELDVQEGHG